MPSNAKRSLAPAAAGRPSWELVLRAVLKKCWLETGVDLHELTCWFSHRAAQGTQSWRQSPSAFSVVPGKPKDPADS